METRDVKRNPFGQDELSMLDPSDFYKGMTQGIQGIIDLTEKVNFHEEYPQNHSIVITNNSSTTCKLYGEEEDWSSHTKKDVWVRILNRHYRWCDAFVRVYHQYIDPKTLENYEKMKREVRPGMKWIRKNFGLKVVEMALKHKKMIKNNTKVSRPHETAKAEAEAMEVEGFKPAL